VRERVIRHHGHAHTRVGHCHTVTRRLAHPLHSLPHLHTRSLAHSPACPLTPPLTHSLTHSYLHPHSLQTNDDADAGGDASADSGSEAKKTKVTTTVKGDRSSHSTTALCVCTLPQRSAFALCHSALRLHSATALCVCTLPQRSAFALCHSALRLHSATALCVCTLPQALRLHSATALCVCTLPQRSAFALCHSALRSHSRRGALRSRSRRGALRRALPLCAAVYEILAAASSARRPTPDQPPTPPGPLRHIPHHHMPSCAPNSFQVSNDVRIQSLIHPPRTHARTPCTQAVPLWTSPLSISSGRATTCTPTATGLHGT
jgi:hypothetical protein